ncbi:MAG: RnfABCDGE type electron transport complex subunit D [Candidatus Margulisiibacteriota bacterium]|nr:RnfABCDGE type electron transport complex subunit D [Candidatus Margulisiibacteriota bacterium]
MNFIISPAPHIKEKYTVPMVMYIVIAALLPATIAGIVFFGLQALALIILCVAAAVGTEFVCNKIMKKEQTITDGSAALTGLLLALCLTPSMPPFAAFFGAVFAVAIGKQIFGGLGFNIFNPALIGRAFLAATFPVQMTNWVAPFVYRGVEAVSSATPLALMKFQHQSTPYSKLFFGGVSGSIGETSALLLLIPGILLALRGVINWRIPASYLGTTAILGGLFWVIKPAIYPDPVFHLLAGGLMLGAFFMATDLVTSPLTNKGMLIFGVGAGILVVIIRLFSGLPGGVMYSILFMNAFVPLINKYTRPRILGAKK